MAQTLVASTEALVSLCAERVRELESLAVIIGQGKADDLQRFAAQLGAVEAALGDVADRVQRDAAAADRARAAARKLDVVAARMAALDAFLAKHAPVPAHRQQQQQAAIPGDEHAEPVAAAGVPRAAAASQVRVPSAEAFESVPRYMRGKLSYADITALCAALNRAGALQQPFSGDSLLPPSPLDAAQTKSAVQCLLRLGCVRVVAPGKYEFAP